jgi:ABC-type sugar transport system ATPase subunit
MGATAIYVTHSQEDAIALADKIAVMKDGELQQIGSANDLYRNPKNTFVAEFVGQPAINLVNGELEMKEETAYFRFKGGLIKLPKRKALLGEKRRSKRSVLGVRPCHLAICEDQESNDEGELIKGEIVNLNYHGDFTLVSVKCENYILRVQSPGFFHGDVGESAVLKVEKEKLSVFDE